MYGFKKILVGLIPQAVLALSLLICCFVSYGFSSVIEHYTLVFAGLFMGVVILVSFLNDEDIHTVWKVFCWIGFGLFGLLTLLMLGAGGYVRSESLLENYPLSAHIGVGFLFASALTLIYLFVVLRIRIWEEESWISKLVVPTAILIVGTIAGGFIRLGGIGLVTVMSYVFEIAPLVVIIVLLILFAKFDVYVGSDSPADYSSNSSRSRSSSSRTPSYAEIYNALIDTSASYSSGGCSVSLKITNVYVDGSSVSWDYEKTVSRNGSGDPDQVALVAEESLRGKVRIKLTRLGLL